MRASSVLVVLLLLSPPVLAETLRDATLGFGERPCRDWTSVRAKRDANSAIAEQWLFGYVSGYDAFGPASKQLFLNYDGRSLVSAIDSACRRQPERPIANVARDFVAALQRSNIKKKN